MAEIVSLKRARKEKARADKDAVAAANRAQFGRTKAEKTRTAVEKTIAESRLEGHKRESCRRIDGIDP